MPGTPAVLQPTHARAPPLPESPGHDDEWTRHSRIAPRSKAAWPQRPPEAPGWSRYCRGKLGAWLLPSILRRATALGRRRYDADTNPSLSLFYRHISLRIPRSNVIRARTNQPIVIKLLNHVCRPTANA